MGTISIWHLLIMLLPGPVGLLLILWSIRRGPPPSRIILSYNPFLVVGGAVLLQFPIIIFIALVINLVGWAFNIPVSPPPTN